ncbi:hypothetical protein [Bacillus sp. FJAT-44742]|nr:hypothetical protein [Bacillus sp. FJAT-44742]
MILSPLKNLKSIYIQVSGDDFLPFTEEELLKSSRSLTEAAMKLPMM